MKKLPVKDPTSLLIKNSICELASAAEPGLVK